MQSLAQAREAASAQSAALSNGVTAYHVAGDRGPWAVLVHGLVTPGYAWEPLSEVLVAQGFRVLRYDQLGRGLSDRPRVRYDLDLYVGQLRELVDTLGIESVHLIGWSLGAVIVTRFAPECPDRVASVAHLSRPYRFPDYSERAREQLRFPGMAESFASTVANYPAQGGDQWASVGAHPRPVLVVWGTEDEVTPFANNARVLRLYPRAELLAVQGAKHAPHLDHPEIVHPAILRHVMAAENRP